MRHTILRAIAASSIAMVLLCGAAAAAIPTVRHAVSGWWNNPDRLAALPENPQVHYETGALTEAREVAAILPAAVAQVEAAQGRRFANPVTVGVFVSPAAFAAANGVGSLRAVGTTFLGRVTLSPVLFSRQRQRLPAILTHELSHAHLQSWMPLLTFIRLPNWFKEGLAVLVSGGGGAEGVSDAQARDAIRRGDHIAIESAGSLLRLTDVRFERSPQIPDSSFRIQLAYRQAESFVAFLRDSNPTGFATLLNAIFAGRPFAEAVSTAYKADLPTLWSQFAGAIEN